MHNFPIKKNGATLIYNSQKNKGQKQISLYFLFYFIDNKSFIDEKEQRVYDCKLTALETNTIKSLGKSNRDKEIRQ